LWNESDRTITAWRLSLARSDRHGHAQKSSLDQDFFDLDGAAASYGSGPLGPGENLPGKWHLDIGEEEPRGGALSVKVVAVIFEDATWQGDGRAVEGMLEAREARVAEIGKVLTTLEGADRRFRSRQDWALTLKQQARRLRQQGQDQKLLAEGRRETAAQISAIRLELAQWLDDAGHEVALAPNPDETMVHLKRALEQRHENGLKAVESHRGSVGAVDGADGGER
jgi:hypothetical protein